MPAFYARASENRPFSNGEPSLTIGNVDALAARFGLQLSPVDEPATAKAKVKAPAIPAVDWGKPSSNQLVICIGPLNQICCEPLGMLDD